MSNAETDYSNTIFTKFRAKTRTFQMYKSDIPPISLNPNNTLNYANYYKISDYFLSI